MEYWPLLIASLMVATRDSSTPLCLLAAASKFAIFWASALRDTDSADVESAGFLAPSEAVGEGRLWTLPVCAEWAAPLEPLPILFGGITIISYSLPVCYKTTALMSFIGSALQNFSAFSCLVGRQVDLGYMGVG